MKLYEKLRPKDFSDMVGQSDLLKEEDFINRLIKNSSSIIIYGPPGVGKTTFAKIYAGKINSFFYDLSTIFTSTAELKKIFKEAEENYSAGNKTVIMIDEIHRFNKTQQDLFLPVIENGSVVLVGCTTENPSFSLNNALISRCNLLKFGPLTSEDLISLVEKVEEKEGILNISEEQRDLVIKNCNGDARVLISVLEYIYADNKKDITDDDIIKILQTIPFKSDKKGDTHYSYFSAFQKSIRGSDDASAMLYFVKMVENGEDVLSIARRMLIIASEDVGLADPQALIQVKTAIDSYKIVGEPEGLIIMGQAVNYLALAPKSNASYKSVKMAREIVVNNPEIYPPKKYINASSKLDRKNGFGRGYIYDHDQPDGCAGQDFYPESLKRTQLYKPKMVGFERELRKRLEYFSKKRDNSNK